MLSSRLKTEAGNVVFIVKSSKEAESTVFKSTDAHKRDVVKLEITGLFKTKGFADHSLRIIG